ncbi:MAG: Gfo/Idh/MocA family oxidoreductase [Verrucomicrobiales bacterium]|nr:Gfo/Idh/MocA family oxidoreductase [Verrucomicrobiales bacterium]
MIRNYPADEVAGGNGVSSADTDKRKEKATWMSSNQNQQGWGLIGPGRFAREFAEELREAERARLVAVASRKKERADSFAAEFGFERAYGSYEELFADDDIDIVYIVVPHVFHREISEMAIDAGKAVVCEKPLTPGLAETDALLQKAGEKNVFLMEAMKTGFLPAIRKAVEWIESGRIGDPVLLRADFCFRGSVDPADRLMNPDLGGGAVLDVGIYPVYLAQLLFGKPREVAAVGALAETGVEESAAIVMQHDGGVSSSLTCSFRTEESMDAVIQGTEGEIRIPTFHAAKDVELWRNGKRAEAFSDPVGAMVGPEIEAVMDALAAGLTECPGHDHRATRDLAGTMDEICRRMVSEEIFQRVRGGR